MANHNRNLEPESASLASPEGNKKLIHLSRKVLECVRRSKQTTGNTIAREIIRDLPATLSDVDFKNIQRRVYDALNVLHALKIITKVRNEIKYQGGISSQSVEDLKLQQKHSRVRVEAKRACLSEKFLHLVALQRLVKRNQDERTKPLLHVPCVIVCMEGSMRITADEVKMIVTSDKQFSILNDVQLLAKLRLHEIPQSELLEGFPRDVIRLISGDKPEVSSVIGPLFMPSPLKTVAMDYRQFFLRLQAH
mmetsp:Transcript_26722/g.48143  ORF Transcript_26722/g.48143 Transcript_26722/m.48143 type:complete len:250 (-) Transcript_26722:1242-1991(-)